MKSIIEKLIQDKKEGDWWDFKQEHHSNPIDLLHDIICLANVVYEGDRYLIIGVNDSFEIVGAEKGSVRRTQADIIDFLRKKSFAFHSIPEVSLDTIILNNNQIDIITIKNARLKPYFLTKDESKNERSLRSGTIYTRSGDTNTPKNSSANPYEIQAMWRERFGLNQKASERFIDILLDTTNWIYDGINKAFYDIDPNYTLEISESENYNGQFWWEVSLPEKPYKYCYKLKYNNVVLHKIKIIHFDSENLKFPFPDIEYVDYPQNTTSDDLSIYCDLFYYIEGTIKFSLFKHMRSLEVSNINHSTFKFPLQTQVKPPIITLPFIVFDSDESMRNGFNLLKSNLDNFKQTINSNNINGKTERERNFSEWAAVLLERRM